MGCTSEQAIKNLGRYVAKGATPWNKGLTKETNESIRRGAEKLRGIPKSEKHKRNLSQAWINKTEQEIEKTRRKMSIARRKWIQRNPEKARVHFARWGHMGKGKTGIKKGWAILKERAPERFYKSQSELGKRGGKATVAKYGGWSSFHKIFKKRNPDAYHEHFADVSRIGALAALRSRRENYPYYINDVPFDSGEERQAMRIICKKFNIVPIEGVNCHVGVNGGEIDFRPIENLFIEYHPWDQNGLTRDQYFDKRRKLLDENGFRDCKLVVAESLDELCREIKK